ncbi:hypothetical protein Tco_1020261 [Tanacetum coccineum]|uniref:Uncharacterized protein n=1 Tax=Tanacetum coccineum TaxID=301880 RepID=A0ABQ5FZI5_9ASTR
MSALLGYSTFRCVLRFEGVTDWYQSQGYREPVIMSSATSAVTYTSVYTDSDPRLSPARAFWGTDERSPENPQTPPSSSGRGMRCEPLFEQAQDPDSEYVPEQGHLDMFYESDPEVGSKEYDVDETEEFRLTILWNDEEERRTRRTEEHLLQLTLTTVYKPVDEPFFPYQREQSIIPPPSTNITIGARITVRPQTSISLPPELEVERLLTMTTPSPSPPISLSPPSAEERLARDDIPESEQPPRKRLYLSTIGSRYEIGESSTARPTRGRGIDYGFVSTVDAEERQQGIRDVRYGIRGTWVDPAEAVSRE